MPVVINNALLLLFLSSYLLTLKGIEKDFKGLDTLFSKPLFYVAKHRKYSLP